MDKAKHGFVRDLAEEAHASLQLARLQLRDQPDGPIEQPYEPGEGRQPLVKGDELSIFRIRSSALARRRRRSFDDLDNRVALTDLPSGDDTREPLPMVADREVRVPAGPRRPTRLGSGTRSTMPHAS